MKFAAILIAALIATGCATDTAVGRSEVTPEILAGKAPTPEQAERAVMQQLASSLKDPDSIKQFKMLSPPILTTWYQGLLAGADYEGGWMVCFEFNAKNSYGGYVGVKKERVVVRMYGDIPVLAQRVNWPLVSASC